MKDKKIILAIIFAIIIVFVLFFSNNTKEGLSHVQLFSIKSTGNSYISFEVTPPPNTKPTITGWTLEGGEVTVKMGQGAYLPRQGQTNKEQAVRIQTKTEIVLAESPSPIGVSFRENICTGFLDEYQEFVPPLENNCPSAIELTAINGNILEPSCRTYIEKIPRCTTAIKDLPPQLSQSCRDTITESIHYNSCVENYKDKDGFFLDRWRLFTNNLNEDFFSDNNFKIFDKENNFLGKFDF